MWEAVKEGNIFSILGCNGKWQDEFEVVFVVIPTKEESYKLLTLRDSFFVGMKKAVYSRFSPYGLMQF